MTDELLPCPFCGGGASKRLFYKGKYRVHCNVCDANSGDVCDIEAEAIAAWNTRAATTIGKVQVEIEPVSRGTLTADQVREAIFSGSAYASYDGAKFYADGINMQAIADELNTRAERTCEWEYPQNINGWVGYVTCSACGEKYDETVTDSAHYCPNCGARVVGGEGA